MSSYRCYWKKLGANFEMRLLDKPKVKASGRTFFTAVEKLREAIRVETDDWSPHMAFWPPPPVAAKKQKYVGDWLILGSGEQTFDIEMPADQLFEAGVCPECHEGIGGRTSTPLTFDFNCFEWIGYSNQQGRHCTEGRVVR